MPMFNAYVALPDAIKHRNTCRDQVAYTKEEVDAFNYGFLTALALLRRETLKQNPENALESALGAIASIK